VTLDELTLELLVVEEEVETTVEVVPDMDVGPSD